MAPLSSLHPCQSTTIVAEHSFSPSISNKTSKTSPTNKKSIKKSITFSEAVKVKKTIHINNYTDDEIDACWYSNEECQRIRSDVKYAIQLVNNGLLEQDTEQYSRRGVECKTRENQLRRKQLRMAAWFAVFEEQEYQYDEQHVDELDVEYISHAYKTASSAALKIARATALKDELEAQQDA